MKQSSQQANQSYYSQAQAQNSQMGLSMHALDGGELGHAWGDYNNSGRYYAQAQSIVPSPSVHVQQAHHANTMKRQESHMGHQARGAYGSSAQNGYSGGLAMHDEAHMVGKMENGWANKPGPYSSPVRGNQYGGQSMYKAQEEKGYNYNKSSTKGGWGGGANQMNHSAQSMHKQQQQQGWGGSPTHRDIAGKMGGHSSLAMHEDEHMLGKMDHGLVRSPTRANHSNSSYGMHEDQHVMGNMDQGYVSSPTRGLGMDHGLVSSPRGNHSSHGMHQEQQMMGKMDHGLALKPNQISSPVRANQYGQSMYKGGEEKGYKFNDRSIDGVGYANKSGSTQFNNSNNGMYNEQDGHEWGGKANSYGSTQANHSTRSIQNHHDYEDDNIDDIMDEILTKYPSHNVNGGGGNWATSQKQAVNYTKQDAWAGSAHHESAQSMAHHESAQSMAHHESAQSMSAQSMAWKEKKEGYSANSNREMYSAASGANKFGMKNSMHMNKGGICDDGITSYGDYDD